MYMRAPFLLHTCTNYYELYILIICTRPLTKFDCSVSECLVSNALSWRKRGHVLKDGVEWSLGDSKLESSLD